MERQRRMHFAPELFDLNAKHDQKGGGGAGFSGTNESISKQNIMMDDLDGSLNQRQTNKKPL